MNGSIVALFPTKHAVGIKSDLGKEVIVHIGVDTVELEGRGFESFVSVGDIVEAGSRLVTFDAGVVTNAGYDPTVIVLVSNAVGHALSVSPTSAVATADELDVKIS